VDVETSLSGAAEVVTVHRPATGSTRVPGFISAAVYCSVACTFTVERDGSAPTTTTAGTPVKTNSTDGAPTATAWKQTNNVGTANRVLAKNYVIAGTTMVVGLETNSLRPGENLTIRTSAMTGTAKVTLNWREY
jgi:hypothetical protein